MDNLMTDLMATALQQSISSDQTTPETSSVDINQFPRNGWNAADVKSCLGCTDVDYSNLYHPVEEAMRSADLIEASLTRQRKIKLFAVLNAVLPHDSLPTLQDDVRIKALHQLAIKVNGNVKKRSGHTHHRKRPRKGPPPGTVTSTQTRRELPAPAEHRPNPTLLHTPPPAPQIVDVGQNHTGLGSMLLLAERDDNTQSTCSLKHVARNVRPGAPTAVDAVSFDAWKSILKRDGVIRGPGDNVLITWKWGERLVRVPNERVLRSVVDFMSRHGGFIDFRVEPASSDNAKRVMLMGTMLLHILDLVWIADIHWDRDHKLFCDDSAEVANLGLVLAHYIKFAMDWKETCRLNEDRWKLLVIEKAD